VRGTREWDGDTGLQYNRARYYAPTIGRWISEDSIGFYANDPNLYRYVQNASTNESDPSGLEEKPQIVPVSLRDVYDEFMNKGVTENGMQQKLNDTTSAKIDGTGYHFSVDTFKKGKKGQEELALTIVTDKLAAAMFFWANKIEVKGYNGIVIQRVTTTTKRTRRNGTIKNEPIDQMVELFVLKGGVSGIDWHPMTDITGLGIVSTEIEIKLELGTGKYLKNGAAYIPRLDYEELEKGNGEGRIKWDGGAPAKTYKIIRKWSADKEVSQTIEGAN
jgi:RHS repeat-associated protein